MRERYVPGPTMAEFVERKFKGKTSYEIAQIDPALARSLFYWKAGHGVRIFKADRVCCKLGSHISEVWDDYFEEAAS